MDIKLITLQNAFSAASEMQREGVPLVWLKYIGCGWEIQPKTCSCGGKWVWMSPRPSGEMILYGCVCHHELNENYILNSKHDVLRSPLMREALKEANPSKEDVGKIFYTHADKEGGAIISREMFDGLNPSKVAWWTEISELDVVAV